MHNKKSLGMLRFEVHELFSTDYSQLPLSFLSPVGVYVALHLQKAYLPITLSSFCHTFRQFHPVSSKTLFLMSELYLISAFREYSLNDMATASIYHDKSDVPGSTFLPPYQDNNIIHPAASFAACDSGFRGPPTTERLKETPFLIGSSAFPSPQISRTNTLSSSGSKTSNFTGESSGDGLDNFQPTPVSGESIYGAISSHEIFPVRRSTFPYCATDIGTSPGLRYHEGPQGILGAWITPTTQPYHQATGNEGTFLDGTAYQNTAHLPWNPTNVMQQQCDNVEGSNGRIGLLGQRNNTYPGTGRSHMW